MKSVRAVWQHPTERTDNVPVNISEIKGVELAMSVDPTGLGWDIIESLIPPVTTEKTVADLAAGTYHFRAVWIDTDDKRSAPVVGQIVVPKEPLKSGTLTLELV